MYYKYFGLREAPFQFLPSNTLFLSAAHLEGLAALEWAFQEPSGLTLLVGEVGTGKTMLIHALVTRLKDDRVRIAQLSHPTMSFEQILDVIVQQLRIHPVGKGKLATLQALKTFVTDPESTDRVILIFDEAQGLSDETLEELRLLSNSRPPQRHALQIILVGQPELAQRLTDPKLRALNQRIGARALLRPLRGGEVRDYVNCLLRAQGARRELFSFKAMDQVALLSGGLPRKINNLCHNSLFAAYAERSPVVQARHVRTASAELENLLDAASAQDNQWRQGWRSAMRWMPRKGKPLMAGGLLALAVVAGALVLESGKYRPNARLARASLDADSAQGVGDSSKPPLASSDEGQEEARSQPGTAAHTLSSQNSDHATAPPEPVAPALQPIAQAPQPVAPKMQPEAAAGMFVVRGTIPQPAMPKAPTSTNPIPARPAAEPPASHRLSYAQARRLQYETRRARSSFEDGRYRNVIYHAKRALLVYPGSSEMRDLLQRAQAAQANPRKTASIHYEPAPSADEGTRTTEVPERVSTGPKFPGVARYEISEGDAYMRAGKYDLALRKFLMAAVLDPGNANLTQRIARARGAKAVMENTNDDSAAGTSVDPSGVP
jgi:type II secretory pathway predicted ATPase ExeA